MNKVKIGILTFGSIATVAVPVSVAIVKSKQSNTINDPLIPSSYWNDWESDRLSNLITSDEGGKFDESQRSKDFLDSSFNINTENWKHNELNADFTVDAKPRIYDPSLTKINQARGTNVLCYYTRKGSASYGNRTGSNEWGAEVVFDKVNGKYVVVSTAGYNNLIPEHGFVLSGHGNASKFLKENFSVGDPWLGVDLAEMDQWDTTATAFDKNPDGTIKNAKMSVIITRSPSYYVEKLGYFDTVIQKKFNKQKDNFKLYNFNDYEVAYKNFKRSADYLKSNIKTVSSSALALLFKTAKSWYEKSMSCLGERKYVGEKAIWIRPSETNLSQVTKVLDDIKRMGLNSIYLEMSQNDGEMSFDTSDFNHWINHDSEAQKLLNNKQVYTPTYHGKANLDFGDYKKDILLAYIAEANKRGIHVSAWLHNFHIGIRQANAINEKPGKDSLLDQHPEWFNRDFYGGYVAGHEGGFYSFLDTANKEAQNYLTLLNKWIESKYIGLSGVQLDYMRYPVEASGKTNVKGTLGFNPDSIRDFITKYKIFSNGVSEWADLSAKLTTEAGRRQVVKNMSDKELIKRFQDSLLRTASLTDPNKNLFTQFKIKKIIAVTEFARRNVTQAKAYNKVVLSTTDGPDISHLNKNYMDWLTWTEQGWFDLTMPQAYFADYATTNKNVAQTYQYFIGRTFNVPGISPVSSGGGGIQWINQFENLLPQIKSFGAAAFTYTWLTDYDKLLFREEFALSNDKTAVSPTDSLDLISKALSKQIADVNKHYGSYETNITSQTDKDEFIKIQTAFNEILSDCLENPSDLTAVIAKSKTLFDKYFDDSIFLTQIKGTDETVYKDPSLPFKPGVTADKFIRNYLEFVYQLDEILKTKASINKSNEEAHKLWAKGEFLPMPSDYENKLLHADGSSIYFGSANSKRETPLLWQGGPK